MQDEEIVRMLFERNEQALIQVETKYGHRMKNIASNILDNTEDSEECYNEALLRLWNSVPPAKPENLQSYLVKITRSIAFNMINAKNAAKRKGDRYAESFEELAETINSDFNIEKNYEKKELKRIIERFLQNLSYDENRAFIGRYFYCDTYEKISEKTGLSIKRIRNLSDKARKKLAVILKKEGYDEY